MDFIKNIDTNLFLFLNGLHNSFFDEIMFYASNRFIWIPLYLIIIYFIVRKFKIKGIFISIILILTVALADDVSVHFFKNIFLRYRPCHNLNIQNLVHIVHGHCGGQYGFISSHASNVFTVASMVSLIFKNKKVSIFIFVWAIFVSYSRIYLGVHYPLDVVVGALLGLTIGYLSYKMTYKYLINYDKRN